MSTIYGIGTTQCIHYFQMNELLRTVVYGSELANMFLHYCVCIKRWDCYKLKLNVL
jgi:hypothetical protein